MAVDYSARYSLLLWGEHWTGDWRTAMFADRLETQHDQVAVVTVSEETLTAFPYRAPVDRAFLAKLVETLDTMGVKAIGLDFLFIRPTEPTKDQILRSAIAKVKTPVVVAAADARVGLSDDEQKFQREFIAESGARAGYANLLTGADRVVRFLAPPAPESPFKRSFAATLADPGSPPLTQPRRIAWLLKPKDDADTFQNLPAHLIAPPALPGPSPMAATLGRLFKGKIVIVGADLPDMDRHQTPLPDWENERQAGVFLQAQVVAQILDNRDILRVSRQAVMVLYFALTLLGIWLGMRHGVGAYALYGGSAAIGIAAADVFLFTSIRQFLPFGACMMALILGIVGGMVIRRLFRFLAS